MEILGAGVFESVQLSIRYSPFGGDRAINLMLSISFFQSYSFVAL